MTDDARFNHKKLTRQYESHDTREKHKFQIIKMFSSYYYTFITDI